MPSILKRLKSKSNFTDKNFVSHHGSAGTGLRNLRPSTGGLAKGTPLNICTSRFCTISERPRIGPELVCTTNLSIMPCEVLIKIKKLKITYKLKNKTTRFEKNTEIFRLVDNIILMIFFINFSL
jgi:hypothetical protein